MNRLAPGLGAAAACVALSAATPALANGRYPAAGQILVDPSDPDHIVIRATYGVLTTRDGGERWSWICETAIGYSGFEDPMMVVTGDGSILAGLFDGLSATRDHGCAWSLAEGAPGQRYVVDLSLDREDPASALLLVSSVRGNDAILTQVWESKDNGRVWTQAGADHPTNFLGVTLDSAPSDPRRLYVSGRWNRPTYQGILRRSDDRGATWEDLDVPGSDDRNLPYIGAVDPVDPDIVYVRRDGDGADALLVSTDGGATWREVFQATSLLGLALSPDGAMIAAGSDEDGLWIAPTSTLEFTKVGSLGVRCLTWTARGLFACADEAVDGFTAGVSKDEGKTFSPLMTLDRLCGPPPGCAPESSTGQTCPGLWPVTARFIGATDACGAGVPAGDAGGTGASAGGGEAGGAAASGGEASAGGGCACEAAAGRGRSGALLSGLLAAGGLLLRARRRPRRVSAAGARSRPGPPRRTSARGRRGAPRRSRAPRR
ncbi:WD40/YVTN/BNR-like repeat-containing protein [Sorangium sp. So ce1024]|uniref:WD40/YVTN/BNR-like repeat-containing protein n=1 Tax=Sorangium sp. So ce1024 TaxID=3133327 RepID=UPI003F0C8811